MSRKLWWNLPPARWGRFALCLAAISVFAGTMIWPQTRRIREMDARISELREEIRAQEMLFPLYRVHIADIQRLKGYRLFPVPDLSDGGIPSPGESMTRIRELLGEYGFVVFNLAPDIARLDRREDRLALDIQATGDFLRLRDLLLSLGRLPYVIHFESLEIRESAASESIRLRIWILRG
jgi:hypothetical protein